MEHKHLQNKCKPTSVWKFLTILKKLKKVRILRDAFFFAFLRFLMTATTAWRNLTLTSMVYYNTNPASVMKLLAVIASRDDICFAQCLYAVCFHLGLIWLSLTTLKAVFSALFDDLSLDVLLVHLHSISSKIIEKSPPLGRKAFLRHPSVHD